MKLIRALVVGIIGTAITASSMAADSLAVRRLFLDRPNGGFHLYTTNPAERPDKEWKIESEDVFRLFPPNTWGTVPLRRFFSNQYGHFYTVDPGSEKMDRSFREDPSPGNVLTIQIPGAIPLYRRIKPNSNHLYSTDLQEAIFLKLEKTCCYVLPAGTSLASFQRTIIDSTLNVINDIRSRLSRGANLTSVAPLVGNNSSSLYASSNQTRGIQGVDEFNGAKSRLERAVNSGNKAQALIELGNMSAALQTMKNTIH